MGIPMKYLCKMGDYDINYDGVSLKAKVVDRCAVVNELIPTYFGSEDVIGADLKIFTTSSVDKNTRNSTFQILVLCGSSRCLIIHPYSSVVYSGYPNFDSSFFKFLTDPNICFVRPSTHDDDEYNSINGVAACELAARVLKKPELMKETSLEVVARQVGVPYRDVFGSSRGTKGLIIVTSGYERILTQEQVKMIAYDAFKCHKIGHKLLSSLE